MSFLRLLKCLSRVLKRSSGVFVSSLVVLFAVMLHRRTMSMRCEIVKLGCLLMGISHEDTEEELAP